LRSRRILSSLSFLLAGAAAGAEPLPLSCPELGIYAIGASEARDKGIAAAKVKRDIDKDDNFSVRDKAEMKRVVDLAYGRPQDSGTKLSYTVESQCRRTSRPR
jgi:hypothetical protein